VFEALLGDRSTGLRKFGALLAAGMLAKRLPGPLGSLARTLISGLKGDRGFGFWWLVVTLAVALALGIILAILLSPVAAVIALLVVGIWMLLHRARNKDEDQDGSQSDSGERNSPSEPGIASSGS
jgi:Flp pilus assembly protein TadB